MEKEIFSHSEGRMTAQRMIGECINGQHKEKCPGHLTATSGSSTGTRCLCFCHDEDRLMENKPEPKKKMSFPSSFCQEGLHDSCTVTRAENEEFGEWNCSCDCHKRNKTRT